MSEARRTETELHLGKCIDDLDKLCIVRDLKQRNPKMLCRKAKMLFDVVEKSTKKGDEETLYVLYMRYTQLVSHIKNDPEYNRDKKFFTDLLGVNNPAKAISRLGILRSSLTNRYDALQKAQRLHDEIIKEREYAKPKIAEEWSLQAHREPAHTTTAGRSSNIGYPSVSEASQLRVRAATPAAPNAAYGNPVMDRSREETESQYLLEQLEENQRREREELACVLS